MFDLQRFDPQNWKIATRLFTGFGLAVAFTVCACLVAWSNFKESERAMRRIELETIEGTVNALKTASEQSALSALAPDFSRVMSDSERADISRQLDEQMAKIRALLDSFQAGQMASGLSVTRTVLAEIDRELLSLNEQAIASLQARDARKMALERVVDKHAAAIESLERPLDDAFLYMMIDASDVVEGTAGELTGLVDAQLASMEATIKLLREATNMREAETTALQQFDQAAKMASTKVAEIAKSNKQGMRSLLTDGVNQINTLFSAKAEVNFAAGMLIAAGNADDAEALTDIEARFRESAIALRGSLQALSAER